MKSKITFYIFLASACLVLLQPHTAAALSISTRIGDQYTEVIGGDRLYFEVEIKYPENPQRKDLRLTYELVQEDKVIANEKVLKAVETQASFIDYIVVPQSAKSGQGELRVTIEDYENLHKEVSASFRVLKGINQVQIYFFIILGAIALVTVLVIYQIFAARRRT